MIELQPILDKLGMTQSPCPIKWTREHLHFWELGAYFDNGQERWIELNPSKIFSFLGYTHAKILEHELIHALRFQQPDSFWEELIAYQTSTHAYQRFLGPLFSQKKPALLLLITPVSVMVGLNASLGPYVILPLLFSWMWVITVHTGRYLALNRIMRKFKGKALAQIIKLSYEELETLRKKPTSSIPNL